VIGYCCNALDKQVPSPQSYHRLVLSNPLHSSSDTARSLENIKTYLCNPRPIPVAFLPSVSIL
jgi:hypothetical protein